MAYTDNAFTLEHLFTVIGIRFKILNAMKTIDFFEIILNMIFFPKTEFHD